MSVKYNPQRGVSLIESLVAIVVTALGIWEFWVYNFVHSRTHRQEYGVRKPFD